MSEQENEINDNTMKDADWILFITKVSNWEKSCESVKTEHASRPYMMADSIRQLKQGKGNASIRNKLKKQLAMSEKYSRDSLSALQNKKYIFSDEEKNVMKREMDIEEAFLNGITTDEEKLVGWPRLFESRGGSTVDAPTETVIAEIVKARTDMAALIDGISEGQDFSEIYSFSSLKLLFSTTLPANLQVEDIAEMSEIEILAESRGHTLKKLKEVLEAWAKTLKLETKPLSSINPKNKVLSFGSTNEILSQNAPVSKLRQYRRAFGEDFDSKNDAGVLYARHKVKWSGKLEDAPVINYTPQPRAKSGESKK